MILHPFEHARLEKFFRERKSEPHFILPKVKIHSGKILRPITKALRINAMTIGQRIFISPDALIERDGRVFASTELLAHEYAHVLQYEDAGYARFFYRYLRGYFNALQLKSIMRAAARMSAYLSIAEECEAREVGASYAASCESEFMELIKEEARP